MKRLSSLGTTLLESGSARHSVEPQNESRLDPTAEVVYCSQADPSNMTNQERDEIRKIISEYKPKGIPQWLKESVVVGLVGIAAAFVIREYIPAKIGSQTASMATDIGSLKTAIEGFRGDIADIKKDIKDVLSKTLDKALESLKSGSSAKTRSALDLGNTVVAMANDLKIPLDLRIITGYGEQLLIVSAREPNLQDVAWRGTQLSVGQRTFINSDFVPPLPVMPREGSYPPNMAAAFRSPEPTPGTMYWRGAWVPPVQGARLAIIGAPNPNANLPVLPQFVLLQDAEAVLDGLDLKNIVYRNSHIIYRGGPIRMDDVYFVNCTFDIVSNGEGSRFSQALLASVPVRFSSS